jgi:Zn-dependent M28 family amino/carboxypeptidase
MGNVIEDFHAETQRLARVERVSLEQHVASLAGEIGERNVFRPQALAAAADYIQTVWEGQGYEVARQVYEVEEVACANLEVSRTGVHRPDEVLLIGAHYDSVRGSPGANDNASGVAALLELSRLFAEITPAMTVRFVAFVNEEPPFFFGSHQGSMVYAKSARRRDDDIRLMIALETIGYYREEPGSQRYPPVFSWFYPDRGNFVGFVSDFASRPLMRRAARAFRAHSDFPLEHAATFRLIPGVAWSDHWSFWRRGYRAFMVTDTALYRYPYYHTSGDTPDKLTYQPFAEATQSIFLCFTDLATGQCL